MTLTLHQVKLNGVKFNLICPGTGQDLSWRTMTIN